MSNAKSNWKKAKFGDVVRHITDRVTDLENCGLTEYTRGEHFESGNLHLIGRSKLGDGQHGSAFHMRFRPGDVLYVSRNPQLRKVAVADYEGICANTTYVLRADGVNLIQELLPFVMQTEEFVEYPIQHKRGSTNFYLNFGDIEPYEFPLPPLEEQRRIADLLWAADDAIEKQDDLVAAALLTKKAFIEKLFADAEFREVGDYAESVTSGSRWWAQFYSDVGDIFIRVANLTRETPRIDLSDVQYVNPPDGAEMERTKLQPGDLLISVTADLGRIGVVSSNFPRAFMSQHVAQVRLKQDKVIPEYVAYSLLSTTGQKQFHKLNDAGAKAGMNLQNVKRLKFAWKPFAHQEKAMEMLQSFEATIELARQHRNNQKQLKKELLNKTLSA
jgi:type I restriction enzyme, S subunit